MFAQSGRGGRRGTEIQKSPPHPTGKANRTCGNPNRARASKRDTKHKLNRRDTSPVLYGRSLVTPVVLSGFNQASSGAWQVRENLRQSLLRPTVSLLCVCRLLCLPFAEFTKRYCYCYFRRQRTTTTPTTMTLCRRMSFLRESPQKSLRQNSVECTGVVPWLPKSRCH